MSGAGSRLIILLPIISSVVYHLTSKRVRGDIHPFLAMALTYGAGMVMAALLLVGARVDLAREFRGLRLDDLRWCLPLALSVLGIEVGFLLAYRSSWPLSFTSLVSNISTGLLLLLFAATVVGDKITASQMAGIGFAFLGLFLINR